MNTAQQPANDLYQLIESNISELGPLYEMQVSRIADVYALNVLQSLLVGYPYLPFSRSALSPSHLAFILNDIVINERRSIIEFGSGISTILMGRLLKANKINASITSIDHNQDWVNILNQLITAEKLEAFVNIVCAPLAPCNLALESNKWYDTNILDEVTVNKQYDMVLVDGPPAWEPQKQTARFPAFPYIREKLKQKAIVYLDDTDRMGERRIIEKWEKSFQVKFQQAQGSLACYSSGNNFDPALI